MIPAELQADVSQHPLDIFPCFSQTAQVIDGELEHSARLSRKGQTQQVINSTTRKWNNRTGTFSRTIYERVPQTVGVGRFRSQFRKNWSQSNDFGRDMSIKSSDPGALQLLFYRRTWLNVSQLFLHEPPPHLLKWRVLDSFHLQNRKLKRRVRPEEGDSFQGHLKEPTIAIKLSGGRLKLTSVDSAHKSRGAADAHSRLSHTNVNNAAQQFVWVKRFRDAKWCLTLFSCSSYPVYLSHWWWVCCLYNHYFVFVFSLFVPVLGLCGCSWWERKEK